MKLNELIARLQEIASQHGDIDVACTENAGGVAEDVTLEVGHLVLPTHLRYPPKGMKYPYLLIGGHGS